MPLTNHLSFTKRLLRQEVCPSLGCTEPAALALAAAAAAEIGGGDLKNISLSVDSGTLRNALAVGLPGTDLRGPHIAAAAGALIADSRHGLEIFERADPSIWQAASKLTASGRVDVTNHTGTAGVYIKAFIDHGKHRTEALIEGRHNRISQRFRDGKKIPFHGYGPEKHAGGELEDRIIREHLNSPKAIHDCLPELDRELRLFLRKGIEMNVALAKKNLQLGHGLGYGKALLEGSSVTDLVTRVKAWVGAGVEARMAGVRAPVMTSGGSGNSGLTVTLGPWMAARDLGINDEDRMLTAVALAHLANIAVKVRLGRVSPLCGGALGSAMGVGYAVVWLQGGGVDAFEWVTRYMLNTVAGVLCDGAKPACALKIATGLSAALEAANLALQKNMRLPPQGLAFGDGPALFDQIAKLRTAMDPIEHPICQLLGNTVSV